jgi:hypothetical protein
MMGGHFRGPIKLLASLAGIAVASAWLCGTLGWWATPTDGPASTIAGIDLSAGGAGPNDSSEAAAPSLPGLPTAAVVNARYQLEGVVAGPDAEGAGVALIAIDGGAPRALRVGEAVGGDFVLLGVSPGGAILGPPGGPPMVVLEVVTAAGASGPTQYPGQGHLSTAAPGLQPAPGAVALRPFVANAPFGTVPPSSDADAPLPIPAVDLALDTLPTAHPHSSRRPPGRRERLQHLHPQP